MFRLKGNVVIGILVLSTLLLASCTAPPSPASVSGPENKAVISDRTGREWDVTHARDVYGMNPDFYNYGLGIDVIRSIDNPTVLEEGEPGYPDPNSTMRVFGVNHNGEQRAYSVRELSRHEVLNDIFPGDSNQYLAITY